MVSIDDLIAEQSDDADAKAAINNARIRLKQKRDEMGNEAYYRWLAGHFISIERQPKEQSE